MSLPRRRIREKYAFTGNSSTDEPAGGMVGEMAEWFKAHAWKACVGNTTVGSNPTLSASFYWCFQVFLKVLTEF